MMDENNKLSIFVMGIVGVAIVLTVGLIVVSEVKDSIGQDITATGVTNESVVYTNNTDTSLANTGFSVTCSAVRDINGTTLLATNYSCSGTGINATNVGGWTAGSNTTIYVDYNYKVGTDAYNATGTNISKLAGVPTWIGILITVALAFVVLGYFYRRN